ncbi:DNA replication/repair protein RecF [Elusimicrobiota bacterium]
MFLKKLTIKNFRNYDNSKINFDNCLNLIIGKNGKGKTNILEAVFFLSTTSSHRTGTTLDLIKDGKSKFYLKADIEDSNGPVDIEIGYGRKEGFKAKINGTKVKRKNVVEKFPAVLFSPEDIEIIKGSPGELRRMINISIAQINPLYINDLVRYKKVLKERNACLKIVVKQKNIKEKDNINLKIWTGELKNITEIIIKERKKFITNIKGAIVKETERMELKEKIDVEYEPSEFRGNSSLRRDIENAHTTWGAHRDNYSFKFNGLNVKSHCSRGEIRITALLYRMAIWKLIKEARNKDPIIMLDDIFSELDMEKREKIRNYIQDLQTIITSTEMPEEFANSANLVNI